MALEGTSVPGPFYGRKGPEGLEVTGHCPHCGGPVFSKRRIAADEAPVVVYGCKCWRRQASFADTVESK